MSGDPIPRLLAATAALTGTVVLMVRSEPSWTGLLTGLSCLGLWGLGTLASKSGRPPPLTRTGRPLMLKAVIVETPRAPPELLPARPRRPRPEPATHPVLLAGPTRLPEVPTHRQRVIGQHMGGRR